MDLQTLSSLDDLLSDVLLDGVHLWFRTHKMNKDYQPLCLPQETILQIIQKRVIIDRRVPDAVKDLLEINAVAERLNSERLRQNFQVHARRYLNVYLPSAGFEISQTDRYSALTNKSEACVIATRVFEAGHELRFCAGSIANLTMQEERDLEKKTSDFSVIRTSRRGTCLFLGPARFVNHDCDPNCNFMPVGTDVICFKTLKPIEVNEEITTYYGDNYFGVGNQECLCATCERLGRGRYKTVDDVEAVEAVQTISPSIKTEVGPFIRRLRTRSTNPPYYTRPRIKKSPNGTKTSAKHNSIAPIESDTVSIAILPHRVHGTSSFVHRLLSSNSTHEFEGSSSWLHINSRPLALSYCEPSESCQSNSPDHVESHCHQLQTLHNDGDNMKHTPQSPIFDDAEVSIAARTLLAQDFHVLPDCATHLALVMDSATDTSGSSLSTPPYTDSNSDVDIEGDEKGNKENTNQSVKSRMSIAFLCHGSSSNPSSSRCLTTPEQSSPHVSSFSVDTEQDRGHMNVSTVDFHKLEPANAVAKTVEPSTEIMDKPVENKQCPTCKNKFRQQEQTSTTDCERCHRHLSIYSIRWPSRSSSVLKEKLAKLEQAQVRNAERARRRREESSKVVRQKQRGRAVSMTKPQFTMPLNAARTKATSATKHLYIPVSNILENTEQSHQTALVPHASGNDFNQQCAATFKMIRPTMSANKLAMSGSDLVGNIKPEIISAGSSQRSYPRKSTVHFVRHHVHVRVARIPRGIKKVEESDSDSHERKTGFGSHRIVAGRVTARFAAVPEVLFCRVIERGYVLTALGHSPGLYADVTNGIRVHPGCVSRSRVPRRCDTANSEDRTTDPRLYNRSKMTGVNCSVAMPKVQAYSSMESQLETNELSEWTKSVIKRKRTVVPPSSIPSQSKPVRAKHTAPLLKCATSTIQCPSLLKQPETVSILCRPSAHSQPSDLSQNSLQIDSCSFALELGSESGSGNPEDIGTCFALSRLLKLDVIDFMPLLDTAASTTKREVQEGSLIVNPSLNLDPYWSDSRTKAKNRDSESTGMEPSAGLESHLQPICKRGALVQGSAIQSSKRKASQHLPVDGVFEPCRKKKVSERQRQHRATEVISSCPQCRTHDSMLFPTQNHDLQGADARTSSHGTPLRTPTRKTSELDRLSQWTVKEQVPSHGRRRAAPRRQAVDILEKDGFETPSSQDLRIVSISRQRGIDSQVILLNESYSRQDSMIRNPRLAFQDKQLALESGAALTESGMNIVKNIAKTEAHPTITEPATAVSEPIVLKQYSSEEADHVDRQNDGNGAHVADVESSCIPVQYLSKKLQSSLAPDQLPLQESEGSNLNRRPLHIRGGSRLSELEQLRVWTIKNSEPVRSRRTLTMQ